MGVLRDSLSAARKLATRIPPETPHAGVQVSRPWETRIPPETPDIGELASRQYRLETLRQREYDLMRHAFYRSSPDARQASLLKRLFRQVAIRGVNAMSGCDFTVLPELDAVRAARMDLIAEVNSRQQALLGEQLQRHDEQQQLHAEQLRQHDEQLRLLEMLVDYDYR
jgi:hypothetical protein